MAAEARKAMRISVYGEAWHVSDCRWIGRTQATDEHTIWIRPPMPAVGTLWTRRGLAAAVQQGEAAVTDEVVARVRRWGRR